MRGRLYTGPAVTLSSRAQMPVIWTNADGR